MSDAQLAHGERYIEPELSNVLFCLMKDTENDNTLLRDDLITTVFKKDNFPLSPGSGISMNSLDFDPDVVDLDEMLNQIGVPEVGSSRSVGYSGSELARRALQAKADRLHGVALGNRGRGKLLSAIHLW